MGTPWWLNLIYAALVALGALAVYVTGLFFIAKTIGGSAEFTHTYVLCKQLSIR
jgi:hypothetical protein